VATKKQTQLAVAAAPQRGRPKRHWKHSRFVATDNFRWARSVLWDGELRLVGDDVDKTVLGEKKLFRLWKARFIESDYIPGIVKDPLAAAATAA